jgi:hypothetical protein
MLTDHLPDARVISDASANLAQVLEYYLFGYPRSCDDEPTASQGDLSLLHRYALVTIGFSRHRSLLRMQAAEARLPTSSPSMPI